MELLTLILFDATCKLFVEVYKKKMYNGGAIR